MITWDLFISHAWEDKEEIARPLAKALAEKGLNVWYDESVLTIGDSLRRSIDQGLIKSRFGIVILSPNFFKKEWPQKELDSLVSKEGEEKVILPVWHDVDQKMIQEYSLILSDKLGVSTANGIPKVVEEIVKAISNEIQIPKEYESSFNKLYYSQEKEVSEHKLESWDYDPNTFGGYLKIELNILGLDKIPEDAIDSMLVKTDFEINKILVLLRKIISFINKIDEDGIEFFRLDDEYKGRIGSYSLPQKEMQFKVKCSIKNEEFKDGYIIDIDEDSLILVPWHEGNSYTVPKIIFNKKEHNDIKKMFSRLIETLKGNKVIVTKFYPSNETRDVGGFGYTMPYVSNKRKVELN